MIPVQSLHASDHLPKFFALLAPNRKSYGIVEHKIQVVPLFCQMAAQSRSRSISVESSPCYGPSAVDYSKD